MHVTAIGGTIVNMIGQMYCHLTLHNVQAGTHLIHFQLIKYEGERKDFGNEVYRTNIIFGLGSESTVSASALAIIPSRRVSS